MLEHLQGSAGGGLDQLRRLGEVGGLVDAVAGHLQQLVVRDGEVRVAPAGRHERAEAIVLELDHLLPVVGQVHRQAQPLVVERLPLDGEEDAPVAPHLAAGVPDGELFLPLQLDAEAVRVDASGSVDLARLEEAELHRVVRHDPVLDRVEVGTAGPPVVGVPDVAPADAFLVRLGDERPGADQRPRVVQVVAGQLRHLGRDHRVEERGQRIEEVRIRLIEIELDRAVVDGLDAVERREQEAPRREVAEGDAFHVEHGVRGRERPPVDGRDGLPLRGGIETRNQRGVARPLPIGDEVADGKERLRIRHEQVVADQAPVVLRLDRGGRAVRIPRCAGEEEDRDDLTAPLRRVRIRRRRRRGRRCWRRRGRGRRSRRPGCSRGRRRGCGGRGRSCGGRRRGRSSGGSRRRRFVVVVVAADQCGGDQSGRADRAAPQQRPAAEDSSSLDQTIRHRAPL